MWCAHACVCAQGGMLQSKDAVEFLGMSGLPKADLSQIWKLSDYKPPKGQLGAEEFCVACKLVVSCTDAMWCARTWCVWWCMASREDGERCCTQRRAMVHISVLPRLHVLSPCRDVNKAVKQGGGEIAIANVKTQTAHAVFSGPAPIAASQRSATKLVVNGTIGHTEM
jgi:hypothetical protein